MMKGLLLFLASSLILFDLHAAQDFACMQDCYRRGYDRNYCAAMCNVPSGDGMRDQPGLPKNPAFDQIKPDSSPQQLPQVADPNCMKDCQRRHYNYMLCQKQCSHPLYGR